QAGSCALPLWGVLETPLLRWRPQGMRVHLRRTSDPAGRAAIVTDEKAVKSPENGACYSALNIPSDRLSRCRAFAINNLTFAFVSHPQSDWNHESAIARKECLRSGVLSRLSAAHSR